MKQSDIPSLRKMNPPGFFTLQNLCMSISSLQEGFTDQIISEASLQLQKFCFREDKHVLKIANKMLSTITDLRFSPFWVVLLDEISTLCHEDAEIFFSHIHELLRGLLPEDNLPVPVLHHLWMGHLPSLEFAVLTLVKHLSAGQCTRSTILNVIEQSRLASVSCKEPLIYHTVCNMMDSFITQSNFQGFLIDIMAIFSRMARKNTSIPTLQQQMRITTSRSNCLYEIETLLWTPCESISSTAILSTIQKICEIWIKTHAASLKPLSSVTDETDTDSKRLDEDLWYLTILYREWVVAALNHVLFCDEQYTESCLWIIACHHRMQLLVQDFQVMKMELHKFVKSLRSLMLSTDDLRSELQPLFISWNASLRLLASSCPSAVLSQNEFAAQCCTVKNQLLLTFLFHSTAGFTVGKEILNNVTETDTTFARVHCFVCHYQVLEIEPSKWHQEKLKWFTVFANDLRICLEVEKEAEDYCSSYEKLQDDLNNVLAFVNINQ